MKVQVEIMAGLSERLTPGQQGRFVLEAKVEEGRVLRDLLNKLATEHAGFGQAVFDNQSQSLYNNVQVVINGRLLIPLKNLNLELRDGDRILFLPAYAGG